MQPYSKRKTTRKVLRLGGAIAYTSKPDELTCPECGCKLDPIEFDWPAVSKDGRSTKRKIWPAYVCDACVKKRDRPRASLGEILEQSGIHGRSKEFTFESFKAMSQQLAKAKQVALRYAEEPRGNMWIYGACGSGKTHLACAIARKLIQRGLSVIFAEVPILLGRLTEDYLSCQSTADVHSLWTGIHVLILDDLGTEKMTEHRMERLTLVANERSKYERPTIVTSNYRPDDLAFKLADRLLSRLMEGCTIINTGRDDWRIRNRS